MEPLGPMAVSRVSTGPLLLALFMAGCRVVTPEELPAVEADTGSTAVDGGNTGDAGATGDAGTTGDGGGDGGGTGGDGGSTTDPMLVSVSPAFGFTTGGAQVTLQGAGLEGVTSVEFGGLPAAILDGDDTILRVIVPAMSAAGAVDVAVDAEGGESELPGGFHYFEHSEGLYGVMGIVEQSDYVGGYWADDPVGWGSAWIVPVEPTAEEPWWLYAPSLDSCMLDFATTADVYTRDLGVDSVFLDGGGGTLSVPWDEGWGGYLLAWEGDGGGAWQASSSYDLATVSGGALPEFAISDLAQTPGTGMVVTAPAISGTNLPTINRSAAFTWSGASGSVILVQLGLADSSSTSIIEWVTCVATNDGSFTVPDLWTQWTTGRIIYIYIGDAVLPTGTVPLDGSSSGVMGVHWLAGGAQAL